MRKAVGAYGVPGYYQAMGLCRQKHGSVFVSHLCSSQTHDGRCRAGFQIGHILLIWFSSLSPYSWALGTLDLHSAGSCHSHFTILDLSQAVLCVPGPDAAQISGWGGSPQSSSFAFPRAGCSAYITTNEAIKASLGFSASPGSSLPRASRLMRSSPEVVLHCTKNVGPGTGPRLVT